MPVVMAIAGAIAWIGEGGCPPALDRVGATVVAADDPAVRASSVVLAPGALLPSLRALVGDAVPIIVVDGPDGAAGRIALLDAGASDVVPATAHAGELAARVRALGRLRGGARIAIDDLVVDPVERTAARGGRAVALHPREFALLLHLARAAGSAVSRAVLLGEVWGYGFDPGTNVVAVTVSRLRAKLDAYGRPLIATVPGGYRLG